MAIHFVTANSDKLLKAFKNAIDQGHITTWSYDEAGDFTHTAKQWKGEAWLRPKSEDGKLAFYILPYDSKIITSEIYGIYHGRFVESMIIHCTNLFSSGTATSLPTAKDSLKGSKA